jgi:4-hydroxymandelate oxidase
VDELLNARAFQEAALARLPAAIGAYYAGGARDQITLRENEAAWARISLLPRCLSGVAAPALGTTVLGHRLKTPILVPPMAFQRMASTGGELDLVRAAGAAGSLYILSTLSTTPMEAVLGAATGPVWFQLYLYKDRGATRALVERARAAGCAALVLTVDAPIIGTREADVRHRFSLPAGLRCENLVAAGFDAMPAVADGSGLAAYVARLLEPALSWADLDWLVATSGLPVVLKGVMRADDARRAEDHGARALIVSNHGGRQLDTAAASARLLPPIVEAVGERVELLVDGGLRRGTDVVKALAMGARAVGVGRPFLWGLTLGGQAGAARIFTLLEAELREAMILCGAADLAALRRDLLMGPG